MIQDDGSVTKENKDVYEMEEAPTAWLKTISLRRVSIKHCGKLHASSWSRTKDIDCFALVTTSPMQSFSVTVSG